MVEIVQVGSDAGRLGLFRRLLLDYQAGLIPELRVPNLEREICELPQRYREGALLLAFQGAEPIGCVVLHRLDPRTAELKRLYVAPAARKAGAGRALSQAVIALARERGYGRLVLDTHRGELPAAYALYRSLGFVECEAYGEADYACPTFLELLLE
jgi:GNAT superfamily N-acetyltransferase